MTRRRALSLAASLAVATEASGAPAGRLKQSVSRWTYSMFSLAELCKLAVRIGLSGIDLIESKDWPTVQSYGLVPSMTPGAGRIPDGWNRLENHPKLIEEMTGNLARAAEAKVPTVITFSGNRNGLPDAEGLNNCVTGLGQVKRAAERYGVTICMELLNSKVDHKDYMCDHTGWGVEACKRIGSPRVKLLYDIYHMQIMEGDIIRTIRESFGFIGHFHTGGVPGRHELDESQELNYRAIMAAIASLGYTGYIAHEFVPAKDPVAALERAFEVCRV